MPGAAAGVSDASQAMRVSVSHNVISYSLITMSYSLVKIPSCCVLSKRLV